MDEAMHELLGSISAPGPLPDWRGDKELERDDEEEVFENGA